MFGMGTPLEWGVFGGIVLGLLALDLFLFNREAHQVSVREAAIWSAVWVGLSLLFNVFVYFDHGYEPAINFLTAYLVEKSLSVDNLFVFLALFNYFKIPSKYQHRVLFWGVIGALLMRILFIGAGAALLSTFDWMMYVFGAFLIYTGVKLGVSGDHDIDPAHSPIMKITTRFFRISKQLHGSRFFIRENGVRMATPLFLVLVIIEFTDVLFAFDSVPAVLAISNDLFIVYTSNIFAILGLRALYFLLAGVIEKLRFLDTGLAIILCFIGVKMVIAEWIHIPALTSFGVICGVLTVTIIASILIPKKQD